MVLVILAPGTSLYAQGAARLRVGVRVVPSLRVDSEFATRNGAARPSDAEMYWPLAQQNHAVEQPIRVDILQQEWGTVALACDSIRKRLTGDPQPVRPCEATLRTQLIVIP